MEAGGKEGARRRRRNRPCVDSPSSARRCSSASSQAATTRTPPALPRPPCRSGSAPMASIRGRSTVSAAPGPRTRSSPSSAPGASRRTHGSDLRRGARSVGAESPSSDVGGLTVGAVGWDVAVLEFKLRRHGLRRAGNRRSLHSLRPRPRFAASSRPRGLVSDGIAGQQTYRSLARRGPLRIHVVQPGESFFSIAARYCVTPRELARTNGLPLTDVIVAGQRFVLPRARSYGLGPGGSEWRGRASRARLLGTSEDGLDPGLVRALAWMESGFQHDVVSNVGAIGVMQHLPERGSSWTRCCSGFRTPRTYAGKHAVPACATCAGSSTSSGATDGWRSRAGTRARARCESVGALPRDEAVRQGRIQALYGTV